MGRSRKRENDPSRSLAHVVYKSIIQVQEKARDHLWIIAPLLGDCGNTHAIWIAKGTTSFGCALIGAQRPSWSAWSGRSVSFSRKAGEAVSKRCPGSASISLTPWKAS